MTPWEETWQALQGTDWRTTVKVSQPTPMTPTKKLVLMDEYPLKHNCQGWPPCGGCGSCMAAQSGDGIEVRYLDGLIQFWVEEDGSE